MSTTKFLMICNTQFKTRSFTTRWRFTKTSGYAWSTCAIIGSFNHYLRIILQPWWLMGLITIILRAAMIFLKRFMRFKSILFPSCYMTIIFFFLLCFGFRFLFSLLLIILSELLYVLLLKLHPLVNKNLV